jgi:hypothetical protein
MSYIPQQLALKNGSNIYSINNTGSALQVYGKYDLPNSTPTASSIIKFQVSGASTFSPLISTINNYYVNPNGDDTAGDGSITNCWKTISKGINYLNALSGDIQAVLNIGCGSYSEAFPTITKSGISLNGGSSLPTLTSLFGNIIFNMGVNAGNYSIGGMSNLLLNGKFEQDNATNAPNSLIINNCIFAPPAGLNAILTTNSGGILGDMTISNSVIYANNDSIAIILVSSMSLIGTQITNNPALSNTLLNFVQVNNSGRFNMFGSSMYQSSASASVAALINVNNNSVATSSTTINNCVLLFTVATSSATGAIMNFTNTASSNTCNFYNNFVRCNCSVNSPNNYIVLKSGGGAVNFSQGNNLGSIARTVPNTGAFTGWTKTTFSAVS